MKKILFLDIDGVLNSKNSGTMWNSEILKEYDLCNDCLYQVKRILNESGCEIVWITSWRNHSDNYIWQFELNNKWYSFKSLFAQAREYFKDYKQSICDHLYRRNKADDIEYYIAKNNIDKNKDRFIILDDSSIQGLKETFNDNFIKIDSQIGITKKIAEYVIDYFKV